LSEINADNRVWAKNERMAIAVKPLQSNEFDDGLVLARLGYARFDEAAWSDELMAMSTGAIEGGALVARNERGRTCGLILYRILAVPEDRPSLQIPRLIAFELMDPQPVAIALVDEVFRLARLRGCETLRTVRVLSSSADTIAAVLAAGVAELHSVF
jgi:hypothetical protein